MPFFKKKKKDQQPQKERLKQRAQSHEAPSKKQNLGPVEYTGFFFFYWKKMEAT